MGIKPRAEALASELFKGERQSLAKCSHVPCERLRNNTPECRSKRKVICFLLRGVSLSGQVIPFVIASFRKGRNTLPSSIPTGTEKVNQCLLFLKPQVQQPGVWSTPLQLPGAWLCIVHLLGVDLHLWDE